MRGRSKGLERSRRYRVARVMEGRDIADSGGDLLQDLETLVVELGAERENAGDPASGLGEAPPGPARRDRSRERKRWVSRSSLVWLRAPKSSEPQRPDRPSPARAISPRPRRLSNRHGCRARGRHIVCLPRGPALSGRRGDPRPYARKTRSPTPRRSDRSLPAARERRRAAPGRAGELRGTNAASPLECVLPPAFAGEGSVVTRRIYGYDDFGGICACR